AAAERVETGAPVRLELLGELGCDRVVAGPVPEVEEALLLGVGVGERAQRRGQGRARDGVDRPHAGPSLAQGLGPLRDPLLEAHRTSPRDGPLAANRARRALRTRRS